MSGANNPFKNPFMRWMQDRLPIFGEGHHFLMTYPTPKNLNFLWNFGVLAIFVLVVMILTGIFLAMQYNPSTDLAFASVDRIMRDVNFGWLIRYIHMNGASFFFIVVYIHIFRGMYYGSYKAPREMLWLLGCLILVLMIGTAFLGYTLPWGQMSFWGAKVITSLFTAIPLVGEDILLLLQGAPAIDNPTLNRFFVLHFLLPFVILGVVGLHVLALHSYGSNNPLGIDMQGPQDSISFHPYYTTEKVLTLGIFLIIFSIFVFFAPELLSHTINNVEANPLVTPAHIVPEWYLLTFYAILRSITFDLLFIEAKLLGVLMMGLALVVLFLMPWLDTSKVRSAKFRPIFKIGFWVFLLIAYCLGIVGALVPDDPFVFYWPILSWFFGVPGLTLPVTTLVMGQIMTALYFLYFLVFLPVLGFVEKTKPLPAGIATPVTPANAQPAE